MFSRRVPADTEPNEWARRLEQRRASGAQLLDLIEQNPTRLGLTADVAAQANLDEPAPHRYEPDPRGLATARLGIAGYYAGRGLALDADDLVLTTGTSEAYSHLFRLLCDPEDQVLTPRPGYPLLEPLAALECVELVPYVLAEGTGWRPAMEAIERALGPRTRAVVIVQPNHPTGSCFEAAEIEALDAMCAARGVAIIADEVFGDFMWARSGARPGSQPSLLGARCALTFVLQGLSKLCGMPQLKLSWIALAGPEALRAQARERLEWIADAVLSVGAPVQRALPRLLEARHAFRAAVLERVVENRSALDQALATCGASRIPAAGGWVALVRLPGGMGAEAMALELLDRDVVVHPGHFYDLDDDAHLVVSLIVEPGTLLAGSRRISEAVRAARS